MVSITRNKKELLQNAGIRFLSFFTKIYPGEVKLTVTLFAAVFLMLTAYYLAKPVRESWLAISVIGDLSKIEVKAYSAFLQSITLIILIPIYGYLFDRLPRGKLLIWVNFFFIVLFPVFWIVRPGFLTDQIPLFGRHLLCLDRHFCGIGHRPVLGICGRPLHGR